MNHAYLAFFLFVTIDTHTVSYLIWLTVLSYLFFWTFTQQTRSKNKHGFLQAYGIINTSPKQMVIKFVNVKESF